MNEHAESGKQKPVKCDDIRSVLFDYLSRELGPSRSELVREHLRRCEACQAESARIQAAVDLLRRDLRAGTGAPCRLSDERRARLIRAVMHPVLDWMYRHHVLVSIAAALAVVLLFGFALWRVRNWRRERVEVGPRITIGVLTNWPPAAATGALERVPPPEP